MKRFTLHHMVVTLLTLVIGGSLLQDPHLAGATEHTSDAKLPARMITMAVEYPGVVIAQEDDVSMDIIFHNKGRSDEDVDLQIAAIPAGWKANIKTYRYGVTGVHVPSNDDTTLTFEASPDENTLPGDYAFRILAQTRDGKFKMERTIRVTLKSTEEQAGDSTGVKVNTSYPVLQGPSDAKFEFSLEIDSRLDQEAIFDLFAQGPEGWDVNFKPAYETKFISSVRLKENQSQTIAVEVKPSAQAQAGAYPIAVRVSSGDAKAEVQLNIILTGTYDLEVGTLTGLLSLDAKQGQTANVSFFVRNTGSAPNSAVRFTAFKPENWKVEFQPETIPVIQPGQFEQVEALITPYEEALLGDYAVALQVDGEKVSKPIEFRVTVKASAAWAWVGIGVIVLVVAGLMGLFRRLGRR
jgi:uncharacterized membrane protein